jgi:hypothetical protein
MTSLEVRMRAPLTSEVCPNCQGQMIVTQLMPILFTDGLESVRYKSLGRRGIARRLVKRF